MEMEGITEYINTLKDAQKQSKRAGNPITVDTLLLIATNTMILSECFPWSEKIWEDLRWEELSKDENYWAVWKNLYKTTTDQKAKFKKQAVVGQEQFGSVHRALRQAPQVQQENSPTRPASDLDEHFDTLAAAATTKKGVLEELAKDNSALTNTYA